MAYLLGLGSDALHPVVQNETHEQDDQEVNQGKRCRGAEVKLTHRLLRQKLR
jgi:hypothetical protein